MEVHIDFTIKMELPATTHFSHSCKCIKIKKRSKFNMYHERTVRSILHLNQIKLEVGKALVTYAFSYIKSLTYITAHTVKTVQNLCQALEKLQASTSTHERKMVLQICCRFCFFF